MIEIWKASKKDKMYSLALSIMKSKALSLDKKIEIWKETKHPDHAYAIFDNIKIEDLSREDLSKFCKMISKIALIDDYYVLRFIKAGKLSTKEMLDLWNKSGRYENIAQAIVEQLYYHPQNQVT